MNRFHVHKSTELFLVCVGVRVCVRVRLRVCVCVVETDQRRQLTAAP